MSPGSRPSQDRPRPDQSSNPVATITNPTTTRDFPISGAEGISLKIERLSGPTQSVPSADNFAA
jgi:hypothetical protein